MAQNGNVLCISNDRLKYSTEKLLGNKTGFVYYGVLDDVCTVAVKQFRKINSETQNEFQKECHKLCIVSKYHSNIVQIYGYQLQPIPLIITTLYHTSLQELLDKEKLDYDTQYSFSKQILSALEHLHATFTIHNNLSSSNVLIDVEKKHVALTDFGFYIKDPKLGFVNMTTEGVNKTLYRPPEQHQTYRYVDKPGDIWSFGVILYEMQHGGKSPFEKRLPFRSVSSIINGDYKKQIPEFYLNVISQCFNNNPSDRPLVRDLVKIFN